MPFAQLREWFPNIQHIDPRVSEQYTTGSKYSVISITKHPTYRQLRQAGQTVANSRMLGMITDFSAPQVRPIQRVFEIGSRYPYSVAGKFSGRIELNSVFFDSAGNLLGNIFSTVYGIDDGTGTPEEKALGYKLINSPKLYVEGKAYQYSMADVGAAGVSSSTKKPGVGAIRMSLDDNSLDKPFGLVLSVFQSDNRVASIASTQGPAGVAEGFAVNPNDSETTYRIISCLFFEMVKIEDYRFGLSSSSEIIAEGAGFFYTGLVNVKTALQSETEAFDRTALETPSVIGGGPGIGGIV